MLGHKLMQVLGRNFRVAGTMREHINSYDALAGMQIFTGVNIDDVESLNPALKAFKPDFVVNCVGIIKQLEESKSAEPTIRFNSLLPHQLARISEYAGAKLIHISTDCVFSGLLGRPYTEADKSDATDLYGQSKYLGEVKAAPHLTLRTSIIGPELRGRKSLVEWVLKQKGQTAKGYTKALYTGLTTLEMAKVIGRIVTNHADLTGLYHLSVDAISKYDLIGIMNDVYKLGITLERDEVFYCDRRLDSSALRAALGYTPPTWQQLIEEMAADGK